MKVFVDINLTTAVIIVFHFSKVLELFACIENECIVIDFISIV